MNKNSSLITHRSSLTFVVGTRPNYMKIAPIYHALQRQGVSNLTIVHTGQHSDFEMRDVFFEQLGLPAPHFNLPALPADLPTERAIPAMLDGLRQIFDREKPALVIVVGDVHSSLAGALAAKMSGIPLAHVEAGLRCGDMAMPEELNRIVIDAVSDWRFVSEPSGMENLRRENLADERTFFVGNVMIDSLVASRKMWQRTGFLEVLDLQKQDYLVATFHRPANVDSRESLLKIKNLLAEVGKKRKVVFPVHPRTRRAMQKFGLETAFENLENLRLLPPLGYFEFVQLMANAAAVLTDSGGVQEETTFLGVPCLTFRPTTERPATIEFGTNRLVQDFKNFDWAGFQKKPNQQIPLLWDGHAAERIVDILLKDSELRVLKPRITESSDHRIII